MNRTYKIQRKLMEQIAELEQIGMQRDTSLNWERIHSVSCSRNGYFLALERGVDAELAAIACSVHDYGRIITGKQPGHAAAGDEPLRLFLMESGHFNGEEIAVIAQAARNHSRKGETGTPIEEIVKDADVLECYWYGIAIEKDEYRRRLDRLQGRFRQIA